MKKKNKQVMNNAGDYQHWNNSAIDPEQIFLNIGKR